MTTKNAKFGLQFFGNAVELDCQIQDLLLLLQKTEEIEFPNHEVVTEGEALNADIHPDLTRKSFIVLLLISLDDQFRVFCEILKVAAGQAVGWNNLKGSSFERFTVFVEKVCGLAIPADESLRQKIRGLIEVRNCIVHSDSRLAYFGKPKVIETFATQIDGLTIDDGHLVFDVVACEECARLIQVFMDHAYRAACQAFPK